MTRYKVIDKDTGIELAWFFSKDKAWKFINKYNYECANQDEPCYPNLIIEKERIS